LYTDPNGDKKFFHRSAQVCLPACVGSERNS
jgi:hypothetical protein